MRSVTGIAPSEADVLRPVVSPPVLGGGSNRVGYEYTAAFRLQSCLPDYGAACLTTQLLPDYSYHYHNYDNN